MLATQPNATSRGNPQTTAPAAVNVAKAAEIIGMSTSWLNQRRVYGDGGPRWYRCGSRVLYAINDLNEFVTSQQRRASTSECTKG
jgi:hypothetical protein